MPVYLFHYRLDEVVHTNVDLNNLNSSLPMIERHQRSVVEVPNDIQYASDIRAVEDRLIADWMAKNRPPYDLQVLSWQRLEGFSRPAES